MRKSQSAMLVSVPAVNAERAAMVSRMNRKWRIALTTDREPILSKKPEELLREMAGTELCPGYPAHILEDAADQVEQMRTALTFYAKRDNWRRRRVGVSKLDLSAVEVDCDGDFAAVPGKLARSIVGEM
jgi:hypothetical protein